MGRRQIGLKLVMDHLGLDVKVKSFNERLILQKAVYLAQAVGVSLGYYYRWYLRGPYCPAVAEDGFAVQAELSRGVDEANRWVLDTASATKLKRIQAMITAASDQELAAKLELLASVHFLIVRGQVSGHNPREIASTLRRFEKPFTEQQVADALREMESNGIIS